MIKSLGALLLGAVAVVLAASVGDTIEVKVCALVDAGESGIAMILSAGWSKLEGGSILI